MEQRIRILKNEIVYLSNLNEESKQSSKKEIYMDNFKIFMNNEKI